MNLILNRWVKTLLALLLITSFTFSAKSQTVLTAGDIAFTGYNATPNAPQKDAFSFVLLANVSIGTVIHFTENAWGNNNAFRTGENTVSLTFGAAQNAGTEITISGPPATALPDINVTATIAGGGSAGTLSGTMLSMSVNGDQVIAYQSATVGVAPFTFISAINMNVYVSPGDPSTTDATNWDNLPAASQTTNSSFKPTGLTTGTNCIWIGTQGNSASERNNARFNCSLATAGGANLSTAAGVRAACNNQAFWDSEFAASGAVPTWVPPSGCAFITAPAAPTFTLQPLPSTICEGANTSFTVAATGAISYQWQADNGGGFANITNNATYSGTTTVTLNITAATNALNGYQYRCVATNAGGSTPSNGALLTVTPLPINPTLLAKTPATSTVADGTPVSATFNAGSGGTGCTDDYRYTTNGGVSYLPYTPGSNISTTGLAAGTGVVTIEGRRAACASSCQGSYQALATWIVTPLPGAATTLNAGDIAFSSYAAVTDEFSFVLLRNIGPGTAVNFTNNGWLSTNVFRTGEETVTWTSNAAYSAGTEIKIAGLTATLASGGPAGTVTGTALLFNINGDQVLAYRGSAAAPTFISAIHMNVYITPGDPVNTTAAAWDGTANSVNASALPTGLTTGTNAIWIGVQGDPASEFDNSRYGNCSHPATLGAIATLRAALNNLANWSSNNNSPTPGFAIPTGCSYLGVGAVPNITGQPANASVCEGANTSFTVTATGASTYQWQVSTGAGFNNVTNSAIYSGATTAVLNITATPISFNGYLYQCIVSNGSGSVTSSSATLTVTALPVGPTLLAKTPAASTVADGTPVSATFNAGSGGTGCSDDFRYTTDGGITYLPYTPGSNISTTGLAAGSGMVFIEGRRANCSAGCQGAYVVLASWHVTPLPAAATTLNAGDIAFSAYTSTSANSDFSFVLLKNVGPGTTINFTDNGWLSTNVFRTGENTVTWTAPAGGLKAGNEITISGLTASLSGGGAAGTVTGTALALSQIGDQILAYRGTAASPTFISAIHMNVYSTTNGDPVTTTAAAWDGTANTISSSALPTGLTTGVNAIWIGTQGVVSSEHLNAKYGICNLPAVAGSIVALRTALNNQANWTVDDTTPPAFTLPTGCNYLSVLCPTITVTNPAVTTGTAGTAFSQTFTSTGGAPVVTYSTVSTLPTGLTLSSAGLLSGTPTQAGSFPIIVTATDGGGCTGNGPTYNLVISCPAAASITGTAAPASQSVCSGSAITNIVLSGAPAGSVYNWTRDNTATVTGIAANGAGNITGTLTNTTSVPVTVTFTITPTAYGTCVGTPFTATVLVNPVPVASITPAGPVSICSGSSAILTASGTCSNFAFSGLITGAQEVPANPSTARGVFNGTFNASTNQMALTIVFDGLTGPATAAHIHAGAPGVSGGVIIPLGGFPAAASGTYINTLSVPSAQVANLMSGNTYINIHTAGSPGGEIRGQITNLVSNVYTLSGPMSGSQEVPANASTSTGNFAGTYNAVTNQLSLNLIFNNLTGGNATAAHIHSAPVGVGGGVIIPLGSFPAATSGTYTGVFAVPAAQIANFLAGNTYVNIHNATFPGGEIRGQIAPVTPLCTTNTYLWSPGGETTQSITVNTANTYAVTVTDGNGCSNTANAVVTVVTAPTTANAGADRTLCQPANSINLAGNTPATGTGAWTQVSGPVTASIGNAANPTTGVSGLNTLGVYTFVWTISNAPCVASTDTMTVTVSAPPPFFDIQGAYACQGSTVTLTGPADPNYTYTWRRSLSGINGTFIAFGGTAQTQAITASGSYQLTTTNQFGCSMVDTAIVHIGDYFFNGTLAAGDPQLTNRINRFGQVSTCAAPKACPGVFSGPGARLYDSYTIINKRNAPVCATIGLASSCGTNIFNVAYSGSTFDPANPCTNYLGDPGSSFPASGFMEVTIPPLDTILIVVHEVNGGTGCAGYFMSVDVPRDPAGITVVPNTSPICAGTSVSLTGAVADTYLWTPGGATTQAITVSPTVTTQYNMAYGYGNHGCSRLDSTTITIAPTVTPAFAGNDTATCGTVITLAANTPVVGSGAWSQASGPGTVTFGTPGSPTSTATASVNGTYKLYWTITAGAPCPGTSIDSVIVNFDAQPVANAGPDLTVCSSPGSRTLSAVAPTAGSGVWTFVSGPATASIFPPPTNPNAGVVGMTVTGNYTFVWTVTNGVCPLSRDTMIVVSNPTPPAPVITGGGVIVCQGTTVTLSGTADPNYTYNWEKSLASNGAPFSSVGAGQTLAVNTPGVYRLTVTNQFGCAATSAQTIVHISDYVFNGSIGAGDAQQTGRINRFGQVSTCAAPKACPGIFSPTGARFYDSYQIINRQPVPVCVTIGTNNPCGTNIFTVAYLKTFNPSSTCTNYLGDPGSSFSLGGFFEVTIPANDTIIVVVHEVNTGQGCGNYTLTVNLPRDLSAITATPPSVVCNGTSVLTAPVADSYLWNPGGATTQSITTPPLFVPTTFYATMGYGNNGCTRLDSVTVGVTSLPPTISCPANISLNNTTGQCGRTVTYTTTVGGLPTPTESYTFTGATTGSGAGNGSGSFFAVGTTTVTVTVTNACGSASCSFTVTITDNQPPTVTTATIAGCYPTAAAAEAAALAATSATDNCPGTLTETVSTVGTCSAVVTVRTTDVAGNFTDVTYNTRIDNIAPTVTAGTIASCYPSVAAAQAAALAATSATDNCPGALVETASTVGTCSAVVTVTTTDGCGNATAVTYNTRIDNVPPVITCPAAITVCGTAAVPPANISLASATDNCPGAITITHQSDAGSPSATAPYIITRTYRATDGCGNFSECTQLITVNPIPNAVATPAVQTICSGASITSIDLTGNVVGTDFNWVRNNTATVSGIASSGNGTQISGSLTNTTNAPVTVTFTITPLFSNAGVTCTGPAATATVVVNPIPTVNAVSGQTVCNGSPTTAVSFTGTVSGTVFNWTNNAPSIGLAASGTGNISSFNAINTGNTPVIATITVTPTYTNAGVTCTGPPMQFTITVNPTPTVNAVANQVWCNGSPTTPVAFTGNILPTVVPTTVFNWTNNNTSIGLAASGTGDIASFITTNTTNIVQVATITVTPTYTNNGVTCTGASITFTYTVNPIPSVNAVTSQVVCNGSPTTAISFGGAVAGTVFNWTNSTTSIGLAASGTGNIASFNAINTGVVPVVATITVTPSFTNAGVTCTGTAIAFTITVNPTPATNAVANQSLCNGAATTAVNFTGPVAGTVFTWTNNNTSIGLGASGTGNIPSFTAINTGTAPAVATITVAPSYTNGGVTCTGPLSSFTITVNPIPTVNAVPDQIVCNNATNPAVNFTSPVTGTTFSWTNNNTAIGLGASGTGNVPAFNAQNAGTTPVTATITVTPNFAGCVGTSLSYTITVNPSTRIVSHPGAQVFCQGGTATFTVAATGAGLTYQWEYNGGGGFAPIPGATNPTLTLIAPTPAQNGPYRCVVTGLCGTVTSNAAVLTVHPNPVITLQNVPSRVCLSDTVVVLRATPPLGFWTGSGVRINTFHAKEAGGVGNKTVTYTFTNAQGCTSSASRVVEVSDCPERHRVLSNAIRIFPNPSTGRFSLLFNTDLYNGVLVQVFDPHGKLVQKHDFQNINYGFVLPFNLNNVADGVYTLKVFNEKDEATFRILISR